MLPTWLLINSWKFSFCISGPFLKRTVGVKDDRLCPFSTMETNSENLQLRSALLCSTWEELLGWDRSHRGSSNVGAKHCQEKINAIPQQNVFSFHCYSRKSSHFRNNFKFCFNAIKSLYKNKSLNHKCQQPLQPEKNLNFRLIGLQSNQLLDFLCCWEMNKHSVCVTQRRVFPQPFLLPSQANSAEMFILCWYPSSGACWDVQIHT